MKTLKYHCEDFLKDGLIVSKFNVAAFPLAFNCTQQLNHLLHLGWVLFYPKNLELSDNWKVFKIINNVKCVLVIGDVKRWEVNPKADYQWAPKHEEGTALSEWWILREIFKTSLVFKLLHFEISYFSVLIFTEIKLLLKKNRNFIH